MNNKRNLGLFALVTVVAIAAGVFLTMSGKKNVIEAKEPLAQAASLDSPSIVPASTDPAATAGNLDFPILDIAAYEAMVSDTKAQGKALMVLFWSVDCPACLEELPEMIKIREMYSQDDLKIAWLSLDQDPRILNSFFEGYTPVEPIYISTFQVATKYRADYIPKLLVYDRQGQIIFDQSGFYPLGMLQAVVNKALN